MNHVADPSTNVVDQSVVSSASTTLTPKDNIDTATTEAAASITLDVSSSVPKPGNTATIEDSVSTTDSAANTILDTLSSAPEKGNQVTNTKAAPVGQTFRPVDPKYDFPLRSFSNGKKQKRFNRDWFKNEDYKSWLHCNGEKDAAFCSACINATRMNLIASANADKAFISNGFTNWQDAGTKNRGFDKHFRSETRREAHECLFTIADAYGGISAQLSTTVNEARSVNRHNLLKLLSNVKFLARHALPLTSSGEDSNFAQLYILKEEDNEGLKVWRTEKKISRYVHRTIQNEMMQIMALRVLQEVAENIHNVDFYSIMRDKATDVKNVSELMVGWTTNWKLMKSSSV